MPRKLPAYEYLWSRSVYNAPGKEQTYVNSKASVLKNDFLVWYKISLQGLYSLLKQLKKQFL